MIPRLVVTASAGRIVRRDPVDVLHQQLETLRREVERRTVEWHPHAALVTRALAQLAAAGCAAMPALEPLIGCPGSSLLSRYTRAGLPSVKQQHLSFRLWLALAVGRAGCPRGATIAGLLNHSSPQSFCRSVRMHLECSPQELLARWTPEAYWIERVDPVMRWADDTWVTFDAIEGSRYAITPRTRTQGVA